MESNSNSCYMTHSLQQRCIIQTQFWPNINNNYSLYEFEFFDVGPNYVLAFGIFQKKEKDNA